jgi:hypothetical protein
LLSWGGRIWIGKTLFHNLLRFFIQLGIDISPSENKLYFDRKTYHKYESLERIVLLKHLFRFFSHIQIKQRHHPGFSMFLCCELFFSFCTSWTESWQPLNLFIWKEFLLADE